MENIAISNLKIKNHWKDLTIAETALIGEVIEHDQMDEGTKKIKLLQVCAGVDDQYFREYSMEDLKKLYVNLDFLKVKSDYQPELKDYYLVNGKKFKRVKQLDSLPAGAFIDYMTYTKDPAQNLDNLNLILTVFLLPVKPLKPTEIIHNKIHSVISKIKIGRNLQNKLNWNQKEGGVENYLETPANETADFLFEHFGFSDGQAILGFFFLLSNLFSMATLYYSDGTLKNQLKLILNKLEKEKNQTKEIQEAKEKILSFLNGVGSLV